MAFFGSKSYERELKHTYSTDRLRRERQRTESNPLRAHSVAVAQIQRQSHTPRIKKNIPSTDEFGIMSGNSNGREDPPYLTFSTTSKSASLPAEPVTPGTSPLLSPPASVNSTRSSHGLSSSFPSKQTSSRPRTVSASTSNGSKHSSRSSKDPSLRRVPQVDVDGASSSDGRMHRNSGSNNAKRSDPHVSSELKVKDGDPKSRAKSSLIGEATVESTYINDQSSSSSKTPTRPLRSIRQPDTETSLSRPTPSPNSVYSVEKDGDGFTGLPLRNQTAFILRRDDPSLSVPVAEGSPGRSASNSSSRADLAENGVGSSRLPDTMANSSRPSPSSSSNVVATATEKEGDAHVSRSASTSSSPLSGASNTGLPLRGQTAFILRRDDAALSAPIPKTSPGGNTSDSSFGTPYADFGVGSFSVKRLLSKPAASSASGTTGARSEPDTRADSYDSYGIHGLAARRRRVEGRSNVTEPPTSVYSVTSASMSTSAREHTRKPATSDPEMPRDVLGSLGRAKGLEWRHILNRDREKEKECERGKAHVREGSSFSLSSPSEGATSYPYGIALERTQERRSKNTRPVIQLTTNAVKRLSALGPSDAVNRYERDRSRSPGTPMTFGPGTSPIPSPLSGSSANARPKTGRSSAQLSPTTSSTVVRRAESPMPPVGLTPAEVVAHQYKEQERRRAELEREVTLDVEVPEKIHTSTKAEELHNQHGFDSEKAQSTVRVKEKEKNKEKNKGLFRRASANAIPSPTSVLTKGSDTSRNGEPVTPYYTVFGDSTGRVVAIGSVRDSAFGLFDRSHDRRAKAIVAEISGTSGTSAPAEASTSGNGGSGEEKPRTIRRKLSRKVSSKFKRDESFARGAGGSGGKDSGKESSDGRDEKLDFGEVVAGGNTDDWFSYGAEGNLRARPSLTVNTTTASGRRSATLPREKSSTAVKMSMDSFVSVQRTDSHSGQTLPSVTNGAPSGGVMKTRSKDEKDREKDKDKGRLWGLMRRISSNALKDKGRFPSSTEVVPPVPALPRDILPPNGLASFDDMRPGTVEGEGILRRDKAGDANAIQFGTSPSRSAVRRPSTAPTANLGDAPKEGRFTTLRKKPSITQVQPQAQLLGASPTQATKMTPSPSPMSLDSIHAHKLSDVSSTSYGDLTYEKLVRDRPNLGNYILPPETLCMFDDLDLNFDGRKESDVKDNSKANSPGDGDYDGLFYAEEPTCHQALPVPPRRVTHAKAEHDADDLRSESPTIPSFSADNAINAFGFRKRAQTSAAESAESSFTGAEFGRGKISTPSSASPASASPASSMKGTSGPLPPRPPRSARRGLPGASSTAQSSNSSHGSSPAPSLTRAASEDRAGRTSVSSHSVASTARPGVHHSTSSPSSTPSPPPELLDSQSPISVSDSASSTMTFRDTSGTGPKHALTEQEKLDKWNDLLDRSERAGGTLHVGLGGALLSDQLRESTYEPTVRDSLYDY